VHVNVDIISDESGELECGGDKVFLRVLVDVHSRMIKYLRNRILGTENVQLMHTLV